MLVVFDDAAVDRVRFFLTGILRGFYGVFTGF